MSVVEREDDVTVEKPSGLYRTIEPFRFVESPNPSNSVLILLNQLVKQMDLIRFWSGTELHICADGGANQLYDYFSDSERHHFVPDFITGDFDSIRSEVKEYYASLGARIIQQSTQYATDFMKAVTIAQLWYALAKLKDILHNNSTSIDTHNGLEKLAEQTNTDSRNQPLHLYILSALGGRFDQTVHSISQLYKLYETHPLLQLLFVTEYDVVFLLGSGTNYIAYKSKAAFSTSKVPICGLLPLGSSLVVVSTNGLKYDVQDWDTSMTTQVSSSNGLSGTTGAVITSLGPLVMNIELSSAVQQDNKASR